MIQFNFTCRDGTGRGAAITGPLKDAGINLEYTHSWVEENFFFSKWRTGHGILVVHDYDGENAKWVLERLQKHDKGNAGQGAIFFFMFEGRFENYIKAKELPAKHIVGESPFVPGFIS